MSSRRADIRALVFGRVLFVTGKGGVGKTSMAAAFGRLAAAQGRRTLIVEVDSQQPQLNAVFDTEVGYEPREVDEHLFVANIDWENSLHEWLERVIPAGRIVDMILRNPMVRLFLNATPGNTEVVTFSKLTWLTEDFDLVVVDLPASGHATALSSSPLRVMELFKVGPIFQRAREAQDLLESEGTHVVLVALPEEMVINETVETWNKLKRAQPRLRVPLVVLNRAARPSLSDEERGLLGQLSERFEEGGAAQLLLAGRWEALLEAGTQEAFERLEAEIPVPFIDIPRLSLEGGPRVLVRNLAAALARASAKVERP